MPDLGDGWDATHRDSLRVPPATLARYAGAILAASGMPAEQAQWLAEKLVEQDLHGGRMSHGTDCIGGRSYARCVARDVFLLLVGRRCLLCTRSMAEPNLRRLPILTLFYLPATSRTDTFETER